MKFIHRSEQPTAPPFALLEIADPQKLFVTVINQKAGQQHTQDWYLKRHWGAIARSVYQEVQGNLLQSKVVPLWSLPGAREAAAEFYETCRAASLHNPNEYLRQAMRMIETISVPPVLLSKDDGVNGGTMHVTYRTQPDAKEKEFLFTGSLGADALETMRSLYVHGSYDTFM